jgi:hypothetical protein
MNCRLNITKRIMGVMSDETVQRGQKVKLEAHATRLIHRPLEQIRMSVPDGIKRCQHIKPRVAIELGRENIRLQVLEKSLAQHLLVEMDAVKPGPCRGRPPLDQSGDLLGELKVAR